jgi:hypothetical protein
MKNVADKYAADDPYVDPTLPQVMALNWVLLRGR